MQIIFLLTLLTGCHFFQKHEPQTPKENPRAADLQVKADDVYDSLMELVDIEGYPPERDCDMTLWIGKACAAGLQVNISLVEYTPGEIHRRPAPSCWDKDAGDQGSKSTISNDMLTGYAACLWTRRDAPALERLAAYGEAHEVFLPIPGWKMGEPYPLEAARVVMRPNLIGLVGRMLESLTDGRVKKDYRTTPAIFGPVAEDYERHLQAEGIYLNGMVNEQLRQQSLDAVPAQLTTEERTLALDIIGVELHRLQELVKIEPENPFFHAVLGIYTGDMDPAISLLLAEDTPVPSYVRGGAQSAYEKIHWLRAAQIVLDRYHGE